jgi:hypothetical protein
MQPLILLQALQNPSDEVEFHEFIKLVSSSEKLTSEQKKEIDKLKVDLNPEQQEKINNALLGIEKSQKTLSPAWELYKNKKLEDFKRLIVKNPELCFSRRYVEDEENEEKASGNTLLHRLAIDPNEESLEFLKCVIKVIRIGAQKTEGININFPITVEHRSPKKGRTKNMTALYFAVNKQNLEAVKLLAPYSDLQSEAIECNDESGTQKENPILEMALEKANSSKCDTNISLEILNIIAEKTLLTESQEQFQKMVYFCYDYKLKEILEEKYPDQVKKMEKISQENFLTTESGFSGIEPKKPSSLILEGEKNDDSSDKEQNGRGLKLISMKLVGSKECEAKTNNR